ncbi:MAG TPA: hypothetical protein VFO85_14780, partial [Vicinamibacteria bacterium]|nr:hypothetical protein [Vicinamibacteria bacterium]
MRVRTAALAAVGVLALLETACFVHVTHVADPGRAFSRAREEAAQVTARAGRASELNVLAWDPREREMVRVSVPLWIVRQVDREGDIDFDLGGDEERWRRRTRGLRWRDIERA